MGAFLAKSRFACVDEAKKCSYVHIDMLRPSAKNQEPAKASKTAMKNFMGEVEPKSQEDGMKMVQDACAAKRPNSKQIINTEASMFKQTSPYGDILGSTQNLQTMQKQCLSIIRLFEKGISG